MHLEGLLLDLVPFDQRFLDRERAWINGPMREWWGQDGLLSEATHERRVEYRESQPREKSARFGMETKDGVPIGLFALDNIDPLHRVAEVGAGIGEPAYWSGGYGTDAMLLIVQYAFDWLDLRRLYLTTMGHNLRAQRQVEKCGFTREGMQRRKVRGGNGGEFRDFLWYGMLREEWPGRDAMIERVGLRDKAKARASV